MLKNYSWSTDIGLLILRIGVGAIFITTGYMKMFNGLPSAAHFILSSGTVGFFATLGFSAFWAYLVTAVEFLGGLSILFGIYSRFFAVLLTVTMAVAAYLVHTNFELVMTPFVLFFATAALAFTGSGDYSLLKKFS